MFVQLLPNGGNDRCVDLVMMTICSGSRASKSVEIAARLEYRDSIIESKRSLAA